MSARPLLFAAAASALLGACNLKAPRNYYDGPAQPEADRPLAPQPIVFDDGQAIAGWQWIDIPESMCMDGTPTGIAVNAPRDAAGNLRSDRLVIFMKGGNACLNRACIEQISKSHFDGDDWKRTLCPQLTSCDAAGTMNLADQTYFGVLDEDPGNYFAGWNKVYIPYCSGDWHMGSAPDPIAVGAGLRRFMGSSNSLAALDRIAGTFAGKVDQVVLSGASAGGIGAIFNYHRYAAAFPATDVVLLDDAGPLFTADVVEDCFARRIKNLWRLDRSFPAAAGCPGPDCWWDDDDWVESRLRWVLDSYADPAGVEDGDGMRMGLIVSDEDEYADAAMFYMEGGCSRIDDIVLPGKGPDGAVRAAHARLRDQVFADYDDVKLFLPEHTHHQWLKDQDWWNRELAQADGTTVRLYDWVVALVEDRPGFDHHTGVLVDPGAPAPNHTPIAERSDAEVDEAADNVGD